jgi:hypothetical protein
MSEELDYIKKCRKEICLAELREDRKLQREMLFEQISEYNPNAILLEPRDMYDHAVHGYSLEGRVIYSYLEIINSLTSDDGMTEEDAREHFDYNIRGTFEGMSDCNRPIFMFED